jgi:hypothetical protein
MRQCLLEARALAFGMSASCLRQGYCLEPEAIIFETRLSCSRGAIVFEAVRHLAAL